MTEFPATLHKGNMEPLHLVLDEADLWSPQRTQLDGMELLGRLEEIVRRGRVWGFVPRLITQRPVVLNKDVLSQADILVPIKLTSSQDWAAVGRWIEGQVNRAEGRRILSALPQLRRGQDWVWAPGKGAGAGIISAHPHPRQFADAGAQGSTWRLAGTGDRGPVGQGASACGGRDAQGQWRAMGRQRQPSLIWSTATCRT